MSKEFNKKAHDVWKNGKSIKSSNTRKSSIKVEYFNDRETANNWEIDHLFYLPSTEKEESTKDDNEYVFPSNANEVEGRSMWLLFGLMLFGSVLILDDKKLETEGEKPKEQSNRIKFLLRVIKGTCSEESIGDIFEQHQYMLSNGDSSLERFKYLRGQLINEVV